jgi:hypothetical protein
LGSPYGLELVENCVICKLRTDSFFCGLPKTSLEAFEKLKFTAAYPAGAVLFVEGQSPRGIYMLCKGRVKLSTTSSDGKTLILKIVQPGEVLGLHASVSNTPYEITAETGQPCQLNFIKREGFSPLPAAAWGRLSKSCTAFEPRLPVRLSADSFTGIVALGPRTPGAALTRMVPRRRRR